MPAYHMTWEMACAYARATDNGAHPPWPERESEPMDRVKRVEFWSYPSRPGWVEIEDPIPVPGMEGPAFLTTMGGTLVHQIRLPSGVMLNLVEIPKGGLRP